MRLKGAWKYLYRAVDKTGARVDFLLTANGIAKPRRASRPRRSVIMTLLRKPRSTRAAPTRRRSQATTRNMRRALKSVRSNISRALLSTRYFCRDWRQEKAMSGFWLERFPFERNRSNDKKSLKIKTLEQALIEKVYQLFRSLLQTATVVCAGCLGAFAFRSAIFGRRRVIARHADTSVALEPPARKAKRETL